MRCSIACLTFSLKYEGELWSSSNKNLIVASATIKFASRQHNASIAALIGLREKNIIEMSVNS